MKKTLTFIAACLTILAAVSCGPKNNRKAADVQPVVEKSKAQVQTEQIIKMQLDSLADKFTKIDPVGVIGSVKGGKIVLSEQEKQVKPDYLAPASVAADLQTLSQKYRAIAMLSVDSEIAKMYEMPVADYTVALTKLFTEVNDPALKNFADQVDMKEAVDNFYKASKENGREFLFWETVSASLIEQIYIVSQNVDKFIVAFDDKSACDFTYDIVLLTIALDDLAAIDPTYETLVSALAPLQKINAINVDQFRSQLIDLKEDIANSHANLLK